ncbi:MAG: hypothetical protein L6Q83_08580 [Gammaproteobacteria bacterium]|nr:hypothetical protein [Gammaproteobacteria bacterium]
MNRRVSAWRRRTARYLALLLGPLALVTQAATIESAADGDWSQAATWIGGVVPAAGDAVRIQAAHRVRYDVDSAEVIGSILIHGALAFAADRSTRLEVGLLVLGPDHPLDMRNPCDVTLHEAPSGAQPLLEIGTQSQPVPRGVTALIRLHGSDELDAGCGPALISHGGRVELHGAVVAPAWTELAVTAPAGATAIELDTAVDWAAGDRIIVVGTLAPPGRFEGHSIRGGELQPETEKRFVMAVSADGRTVSLDRPLAYSHRGGPHDIDRRGEVANLSRNVIIESADPDGTRGHTMFHRYSAAAISHAEFRHLGKEGLLGRYPLHFHLVDDTMRGSYLVGASIWDSANRWVSVHGAAYLTIRDNVGFGALGHGFFLENGAEVYNLLAGNLGVQSYVTDPLPNQALAYDGNRGACYWAANARNFLYQNTFAECDNDMSFILDYAPGAEPMWTEMLQPDGSRSTVDVREVSGGLIAGLEVHSVWGWGPWIRGARYPDGDALLFRDSRVWRAHYSIDISGDNVIFDGVNVLDSSYGFYNQFPGPHLVRNAFFDRVGPHGTFMTYLGGHGTFLYEDIEIANSELAFRLDAKSQSGVDGSPIVHHLRNVTMLTPTFVNSGGQQNAAWAGTEGDNVRTDPLLLLVHHDAAGAGLDRIFVPERQSLTLPGIPAGLAFSEATGVMDVDGVLLEGRGAVRYAEGAIDWPASPLEHQVDSLPPATIILRPQSGTNVGAEDDSLEVCGVALDQGGVASVTVNGVSATLAANGFDWCAILDGLRDGPNTITAQATDNAGNSESTPHRITVNVSVPVPDTDGDGVRDDRDNCLAVANGTTLTDPAGHSQRDTNADGFGNMCDADLNDDGFVNFADLTLFRQRFGSTDADADFDGNGTVNFYDLSRFRMAFGKAPGPSAVSR